MNNNKNNTKQKPQRSEEDRNDKQDRGPIRDPKSSGTQKKETPPIVMDNDEGKEESGRNTKQPPPGTS